MHWRTLSFSVLLVRSNTAQIISMDHEINKPHIQISTIWCISRGPLFNNKLPTSWFLKLYEHVKGSQVVYAVHSQNLFAELRLLEGISTIDWRNGCREA